MTVFLFLAVTLVWAFTGRATVRGCRCSSLGVSPGSMAAIREELKGSISFLILAGVVSWLLDLSRDSRDMALSVEELGRWSGGKF